MSIFELRGSDIYVEEPDVYPSPHPDAAPETLTDTTLRVFAVILAARRGDTKGRDPYAYIDSEPNSSRGIWLEDTPYTVVE